MLGGAASARTRLRAGEQKVAEAIDLRGQAREHNRGRAVFLDDGGSIDDVARLQSIAGVDRARRRAAVEADLAVAGQRALGKTVTGRLFGEARAADRAYAGDTQVHPLDHVAADGAIDVAIAVAEALVVGVVEALGGLGERGRVELARR